MVTRNLKLLVTAGFITASLGVAIIPASRVLAWHPVGKITKFVANETAGGTSVDANTSASAASAKPGDILRYTITVRNDGKTDSRGYNDMAFVTITDTLPANVELVGSASTRTIKEVIPGTIKPGQSVTKTYKVKVTSQKDGELLKNTACFVGDSTVKDNKQSGCDDAYTKVSVPVQPKPEQPKPEQPKPEQPQPEQPKPEPKPEAPKTPEQPQEIPETGAEGILGGLIGTGAVGYAALNYRRSKNALASALKRT